MAVDFFEPGLPAGGGRPSIVFLVSRMFCALPREAVLEVLAFPPLSRPPRMPDILAGFLSIDGNAVPVLHGPRLLEGSGREPGLYDHLMLLKPEGTPLAMLVDKVVEVRNFPPEKLSPVAGKHTLNDCVAAEIEDRGRTIHFLSLDRLLLKEERERLAALKAMEQERMKGLA